MMYLFLRSCIVTIRKNTALYHGIQWRYYGLFHNEAMNMTEYLLPIKMYQERNVCLY